MNKKVAYTLVAFGVFGIILMLPLLSTIHTAEGTVVELTSPGRVALGVLAFAVVLWMTEALPFPVTGLISVVLLAMAKAGEFRELIRAGFGHEIIAFVIGISIFSVAINRTGLLRRVTTVLLFHFGHSPRAIILTFLVVGMFTSMWITDMAVAGILMSIGVGILKHANVVRRKSNLGRA